MAVTIYHNPRCSKSRQTLNILQERDIDPDIVEYLNTPPDAGQLAAILDLLGLEPRELMRSGESAYKQLNLDNEELSRDELIAAMVENPILIERPIVVSDRGARIGRPPESVLEIL